MRTRIQSSGISKSARELSRYLGIKRLKQRNSRFRFKPTDTIINWGLVPDNHSIYLNPLDAVSIAADKLKTFQVLSSADISIPEFTTTRPTDDSIWLARTTLHGHSGSGIVIGTPSELPHAPLYVKHIPKIREYRAIVVAGELVDFKQKKKRRLPEDSEDSHDPYVWNHSNHYVFCRNDIIHPPSIANLSISAMNALGLLYGALDIIEDETGKLYVLEVNTKFGLDGTTTSLVGDAIHAHISQTYRS